MRRPFRWARLGSNQRPLACEASALPLSYAPGRGDHCRRSAILPGIESRRHSYGELRDQFGELTRPDSGSDPWPVAVLIHGGFWRERYSLRLEDRLVADLAGRGWAVWNLEYRRVGRRSRGGWPATFEDVAAGIDHLADLDEPLDLDRVIAIGHSAGGHLALWAAGRPSRVRLSAAVSQAGLLDLREAARRNLSDGAVRELLGGSPEERPDRYDAASPIELLPLDGPTLLVHGADDEVVPPDISRAYARRATHACELVELPGVGHMEHLDPDTAAWRQVTAWLEAR